MPSSGSPSGRPVRTTDENVFAEERDWKELLVVPKSAGELRAWWANARFFAPQAGMILGGTVLVYGVSKMVMTLTSSLLSMNFTTVGIIGFGAGFVSAGLCAAAGLSAWQYLHIRPEVVHQLALKKLQQHPELLGLLGGEVLRSGALRAYTLRSGHLGYDTNNKLRWLEPRLQMLFQVQGSDADRVGMVTIEAEKVRGTHQFSLVCVDVLDRTHARSPVALLVEGSEERLHVRGQLREFLTTERVPDVEPVRAPTRESER